MPNRVVAVLGGALLLIGTAGAPATATGSVGAGDVLPACTSMSDWPTERVSADVRAAVVSYYRARDLLPVRIVGHREYVLDVREQRVGTHWCVTADGTESGYVGQVPKWATRAVMVYARHQPYPVTESAAHFVTLAKAPGRSWAVVGEDTGP
jgi:hypothetical protein